MSIFLLYRSLDYVKIVALLVAATALCPGCFAVGSEQRECTEDDLLNGCNAPDIRNASPISSLDPLLQAQCSESQDGCSLVSIVIKHTLLYLMSFCPYKKLLYGGPVLLAKHTPSTRTHVVAYCKLHAIANIYTGIWMHTFLRTRYSMMIFIISL